MGTLGGGGRTNRPTFPPGPSACPALRRRSPGLTRIPPYAEVIQHSGSNSLKATTRSRFKTIDASRFARLTCAIISRQRPQGGTITSPLTATAATMRHWRALSISAIAACSAQNPMPQARSMQMPVNTSPRSVRIAAAQAPAENSPSLNSPQTPLAASMSDSI